MEGIRIGRISALNYEAGTARIFYTDKNENTTAELPLLSAEYFMPEVDDLVLVLHLPNGTAAGFVLGRFWSDINRPLEGKRGLYRKDLSRTAGKAMMRYAEDEEQADVVMPNLRIATTELEIETQEIGGSGETIGFQGDTVSMAGTASATISGGTVTISGDTVTISGGTVSISGTVNISGTGDVLLDGISLKNHTHTCSTSGSQSSKAN